VSEEFTGFCYPINDEAFFYQPTDKWSVAQNVKHLIKATDKTKLAFSLPKFVVRLYVGRPNRPSRSYDELVSKYKLKLEKDGRSIKRFIPELSASGEKKEILLSDFSHSMNRLVSCIERKWKDPQLDQYIAPHPLLGKITLRELCYFTIHHTHHHLDSIKTRLREQETIHQV
jgi:hypothetical protein